MSEKNDLMTLEPFTRDEGPFEAKYGLPQEVQFCRKCVMSNQRPNSTTEFKHVRESKKETIRFDGKGV